LGSRDVIGHVTIRLLGVDFLWVVHGDHVSIWHRYGDMAPQMLDTQTLTRKEKRREREKGRERKGKKVAEEKKGKGKGEGEGKGKEERKVME